MPHFFAFFESFHFALANVWSGNALMPPCLGGSQAKLLLRLCHMSDAVNSTTDASVHFASDALELEIGLRAVDYYSGIQCDV